MLSIPDMALLGAAALIFFGPEQLPKVARKVGLLVRDVQNTSQTFIREMERAADEPEPGHDVSRAHLLDEVPHPYAPPEPAHDAAVYGAYDGGYMAAPEAHDVPVDEAPTQAVPLAVPPVAVPPLAGHEPAP
jgi:sec-independent protein translocase protein TatA